MIGYREPQADSPDRGLAAAELSLKKQGKKLQKPETEIHAEQVTWKEQESLSRGCAQPWEGVRRINAQTSPFIFPIFCGNSPWPNLTGSQRTGKSLGGKVSQSAQKTVGCGGNKGKLRYLPHRSFWISLFFQKMLCPVFLLS